MARFPTMPLRTDALLGDTGHLTATEFGGYLRIIIAMWRNGAWLPSDDRLLRKYSTLHATHWKRSRTVICAFLTFEGDRVTQNKVTEEWELAIGRSEKAAKSANSRWEGGAAGSTSKTYQQDIPAEHTNTDDKPLKTNDLDNANAQPEHGRGNAIQNPESIEKKDAPLPNARAPDSLPIIDPNIFKTSETRERVLEAAGIDISKSSWPTRWLGSETAHTISQWGGLDLTEDEIVETVTEVMAKRTDPPKSLEYFTPAMRERAGRKLEPALTPTTSGGSNHVGQSPRDRERDAKLKETLEYARSLDQKRQRGN